MSKVEIIKRPVEQVGGEIKKTAWASIIESFAILILGLLFVAWPDMMIQIVSYVVGIFFIAKGIFQVINYFIEKGQNDFFNNDLLMGIISILIGTATLVIGEEIVNVFRVIIGVFIIYESLVRINTAIKLSSAGVPIWKYVLLLAIIVLILGIFVTFNDIASVIGWMMVIAGIFGIVGDVLFVQQINTVIEKLTK